VPRDGFSELEEFTASLATLAELRERGLLRVRVLNDRQVVFAIDRSAGYVPPQDGSYLDILDVLSAIAFGEAIDDFAAMRATANGDVSEGERERAVWEAKFEAAAGVFPASELRSRPLTRARASVRWVLTSVLIAAAKRSGHLARMMVRTRFRRLIGARGRREAWRALGARIADSVFIGAGVTLRLPQNVSIGAGTKVSGRVRIESFARVDIGRNVLLNDTDIYSAQHDVDHPRFAALREPVKIGDYAWLPHKIIVLPGVQIGDYAVIGTGSVVASDVPDYGVAVGNPARVVKERARIRYTYVPSSVQRPPSLV
jgi:acetyltransferase-like isoleucine patch superfamily enzyme